MDTRTSRTGAGGPSNDSANLLTPVLGALAMGATPDEAVRQVTVTVDDRRYLIPPCFLDDGGGGRLVRPDAAQVLDLYARVGSHVYAVGDRSAVFAAAELRRTRGYQRLGYRNEASYAREELAISPRAFRDMAKLGERLAVLPATRRAYLLGHLGPTKAEVVSRVATADDERRWLDRALTDTVRGLRAAVKEELERRRAGEDVAGGDVAGEDGVGEDGAGGDVAGEDGAGEDGAGEGGVGEDGAGPDGADGTGEEEVPDGTGSCPADEPGSLVADLEELEGEERFERRPFTRRVPGWLVGKSEAALAVTRRVAAADLPAGACWELIAAEFLSVAEPVLGQLVDELLDEAVEAMAREGTEGSGTAGRTAGRTVSRTPQAGAQAGARPGRRWGPPPEDPRSLQAMLERASRRWSYLPTELSPLVWRGGWEEVVDRCERLANGEPASAAGCAEGSVRQARQLHFELREAVERRRRIGWQLGRVLRMIRDWGLYRDMEFASFHHYIQERLDVTPRTAQRLARIDRAVREHPRLEEVYQAGELPASQAGMVARVFELPLSADNRTAWLEFAEVATFRALESAVRAAEVAYEADRSGFHGAGGVAPPSHDTGGFERACLELAARPEAAAEGASWLEVLTGATTFATSESGNGGSGGVHGSSRADATTFATSGDGNAGNGTSDGADETDATTFAASGNGTGDDAHSRQLAALVESWGLRPRDRRWARQPATATLSCWMTPGESEVVERALAVVRLLRGGDWPDWACLDDLLDHFLAQYGKDHIVELAEAYPVVARDVWRCQAPGCTSYSGLQRHHVVPLGRGGPDVPENITAVCDFHHEAIHDGRVLCRGTAPDRLYWELSPKPRPIARFVGQRRLRRGERWNGRRIV